MTDGLDQALQQVAFDLLALDLSLTVYRGGVPNPTPEPPYVVGRSYLERPSEDPDNALTGKSGVWIVRWYFYCVGGGTGADQDAAELAAIAVAQRVRTNLLDVRPTVAGLSCGLIRLDQSLPPVPPDETTGRPVREATEIFKLRATN